VPAVVFVHRHPVEVAASLNKRDRLALPLGLALWESYTRHALRAMEGLAVMVRRVVEGSPNQWQRVDHGEGVTVGTGADGERLADVPL
jgi:hypothetical protein